MGELLNVTVDDDISVMCDGIYDIQSGSYDKGSVARPLFPWAFTRFKDTKKAQNDDDFIYCENSNTSSEKRSH